MTPDEIVGLVTEWFARVGSASLKLPSGWFGRPFDNQHRLTTARVDGDRLLLELDHQMVLTLTQPDVAEAGRDSFRISGFVHATWEWVEYGRTGVHVETFDGGDIEFWE